VGARRGGERTERERERERGEYMLLIRLVRLILMYTCNEFHLNFYDVLYYFRIAFVRAVVEGIVVTPVLGKPPIVLV